MKSICLALAALAFAGCSSYSEIARWDSTVESDDMDDFNVKLFKDEATVDNNLVSLKHALDLVGSHKVMQLHTSIDDDCVWSLFFINRHEVRTQCIIIPE